MLPPSCGIMCPTSPKSSSSRRGRHTGEANDLNPARWVVNQPRWKCYLLSLLRIQHPDCELCTAELFHIDANSGGITAACDSNHRHEQRCWGY